ncbi:hypothetical protein A3750_14710 [Oleiphilus sp. HI0079]|uniref:hypothetical protein n=2 Tax=Oleiphilus sp. HI0079 TaxID=1822254 RepID=UPI0007C2E23B|nr:hypothetical protein [Oleiphilus sp. HI0079]KZZ14394.1 hypothetical protein A3750_14710 [Oleiphilus sp. HI0079]
MKTHEICKVFGSGTVEIREWGTDYHEEVAVVSKASVFEKNLLIFVRSCLIELGYSDDGEMEIRENTSKKPAIRSYRLVMIAKSLSKTRLREIKSKVKAILLGISQGQADWVDGKMDSMGLECDSLPQKQKQEIENLRHAFQKKYSQSKVPNTSIEFPDDDKNDVICVSKINANPKTASYDANIKISNADVIGINRSEETLGVMTQEGTVLPLQFYSARASEAFFGTLLGGVVVSADVQKATNSGNGKVEHLILSAQITLPTGETLTL